MDIVITEKELVTRKSQGTVFICRVCKNNGKVVVIAHHIGKNGGIVYAYCQECLKAAVGCPACRQKR